MSAKRKRKGFKIPDNKPNTSAQNLKRCQAKVNKLEKNKPQLTIKSIKGEVKLQLLEEQQKEPERTVEKYEREVQQLEEDYQKVT